MSMIHQCTSDSDFDTFIVMQFEAAGENDMVDLSKPLAEQRQAHRAELLKFLAGKQKTGVFFAVDEDDHPLGYVWVSERGYLDPWDAQPEPAWVYDLRVDARQRGQGLGQALMRQAETWADQEGFKRIGLHVFGVNQTAIKLYNRLGYTALNCQLQKNIYGLPSTRVPGDGRYLVQPLPPGTDPAPLIALWKENFSGVAQSIYHVPADRIQERFEAFIKEVQFDRPEVETFVVKDQSDALFGFMRLTVIDHHGKKGAWISTLQTVQELDEVVGVLLDFVERWAFQKGISQIATGKLPQDDGLLCFQQAGYTTSNLYMFKFLPETHSIVK